MTLSLGILLLLLLLLAGRELERKYLEGFERWCRKRMEKIKWSEKITNEVLEYLEEKRIFLNNM